MFNYKDMKMMSQIKRALQLTAANLSPTMAREVAMIYPKYQVGKTYAAGDYFTDGTDANGDPVLYTVVQAHISAAQWPPDSTPSLYTSVSLDASGRPIWAPPTGAHDAYNKGDVTSWKEKVWKSLIDGNTTEPGSDNRFWEESMEV